MDIIQFIINILAQRSNAFIFAKQISIVSE